MLLEELIFLVTQWIWVTFYQVWPVEFCTLNLGNSNFVVLTPLVSQIWVGNEQTNSYDERRAN